MKTSEVQEVMLRKMQEGLHTKNSWRALAFSSFFLIGKKTICRPIPA